MTRERPNHLSCFSISWCIYYVSNFVWLLLTNLRASALFNQKNLSHLINRLLLLRSHIRWACILCIYTIQIIGDEVGSIKIPIFWWISDLLYLIEALSVLQRDNSSDNAKNLQLINTLTEAPMLRRWWFNSIQAESKRLRMNCFRWAGHQSLKIYILVNYTHLPIVHTGLQLVINKNNILEIYSARCLLGWRLASHYTLVDMEAPKAGDEIWIIPI
jgi:hypothetical protein